ncbi:MAG: zinc ribbon domain-containing protein [Acidobacteriota bacterium]|nr:zinc ribbon domain-containing protein [Acidobacteriota bacterium]
MYCPQCATRHADGAKFCRSCGLELEAVALVLSGKSVQPDHIDKDTSEPRTAQDWLEKYGEGVRSIATGASLVVLSLLIGAAMALFVPSSFDAPWILIWLVLVSWMAVWGAIEIGSGIGNVFVSKAKLRLPGPSGEEPAIDSTTQQLLHAAAPPPLSQPSAAFRPPAPLSVTEGTTRQLKDSAER